MNFANRCILISLFFTGWPLYIQLLSLSFATIRLQAPEFESPWIKTVCYTTGYAVARLVEALCYKPEGRGFDSRWCHWNFSLTYSFRQHYVPGVDSASNRNEYQE
jgi:hypothetical protein